MEVDFEKNLFIPLHIAMVRHHFKCAYHALSSNRITGINLQNKIQQLMTRVSDISLDVTQGNIPPSRFVVLHLSAINEFNDHHHTQHV